MAGSEYRTIFGTIQFDPNDRDVNGKAVKSFTVRSAGVKDQSQLVSCTLWPSHKADFDKVVKGAAVVIDGKYSVNNGKDGEGNPKVYHNLSVAKILFLGELDGGEEVETTSAAAAAEDGDESW